MIVHPRPFKVVVGAPTLAPGDIVEILDAVTP